MIFLNSIIYGKNEVRDRQRLGSSICSVASHSKSYSWILHDDLNVVRFPHEKEGGNLSWPNYMEELEDCCSTAELDDLNYICHKFVDNKVPEGRLIARKLDRVLVNSYWSSLFPNAEA